MPVTPNGELHSTQDALHTAEPGFASRMARILFLNAAAYAAALLVVWLLHCNDTEFSEMDFFSIGVAAIGFMAVMILPPLAFVAALLALIIKQPPFKWNVTIALLSGAGTAFSVHLIAELFNAR